jgi:hypothetical protein
MAQRSTQIVGDGIGKSFEICVRCIQLGRAFLHLLFEAVVGLSQGRIAFLNLRQHFIECGD